MSESVRPVKVELAPERYEKEPCNEYRDTFEGRHTLLVGVIGKSVCGIHADEGDLPCCPLQATEEAIPECKSWRLKIGLSHNW